ITIALVYWWKSERKAATAAVLVLGAALFWGLAPEDYKGRMGSILHSQNDASAQSRKDGQRIARAMYCRQPLHCVGPGKFGAALVAWCPTGIAFVDWMDVHSLYYQTLSELGTFGSLSLLAFLLLVLRDHRRLQRSLSARSQTPDYWFYHVSCGLETAFLALMVAGLF